MILLDSDILHLRAIGTSVIILNSVKAANDLMEKRSYLYSGRYGTFPLFKIQFKHCNR